MNGSITAKQQNDIRILPRGGRTDPPFDVRLRLKWLQLLGRTSQPEDRRRSHLPRKRVAEV